MIEAVKAGGTVYVTEGESDADAVRKAGGTATTNPQGAGKWPEYFAEYFPGAAVVVVRDRDNPGRRHAEQVLANLAPVARSVRIVEPPGPEPEDGGPKDARAHLEAGGTLDELVDVTPDRASPKAETIVSVDDPAAELAELMVILDRYYYLPDPSHVEAVLAVAATRDSDDDVTWLLIVASPSSGKTEVVRLLDLAADERMNEPTAAGLLGWGRKGKTVFPTGVLVRIGARGLVTIKDLSSLLASSDRGGRDQLFGVLRTVADGETSREQGPPGGTAAEEKLEWRGRMTLVAAVTGVIDDYSAHADALGARWLYAPTLRVIPPPRSAAGLALCDVCAQTLDPWLVEHGETAHDSCARDAS